MLGIAKSIKELPFLSHQEKGDLPGQHGGQVPLARVKQIIGGHCETHGRKEERHQSGIPRHYRRRYPERDRERERAKAMRTRRFDEK